MVMYFSIYLWMTLSIIAYCYYSSEATECLERRGPRLEQSRRVPAEDDRTLRHRFSHDFYSGLVNVPMFHITQLLGIFHFQQISGLVMWFKQIIPNSWDINPNPCSGLKPLWAVSSFHQPAIWEWFRPPFMVISGMVYYYSIHIFCSFGGCYLS